MSNTNTGGQAFPRPGDFNPQQGMTLRDYFAAKAMQAEMAQGIHESDFDWMVARCYKAADAMLAARSQA
jgi:hypothetical protein